MSEVLAERPTAAAEFDESQYILHARAEISQVLRDVIRSRTLITVHMPGTAETLLTPLLALDSATNLLYFDLSGSQSLNAKLLQARRLIFLGSHDKVKIRFASTAAQQTSLESRAAFCVAIPAEMLRLQRREFYRIATPVTRPVKCVIPVDEESSYRYVDARLHDISQGGVSLIVDPGEIPADVGTCFSNCRIALPDTGNVVVTLEVRYQIGITLLNGKTMQRIGCRFVRPSSAAANLVQRYMMRLERERRSRD
jgi:c-di-GMP-binding flagellar brake protein YcgR